jgi:hypothetical protein
MRSTMRRPPRHAIFTRKKDSCLAHDLQCARSPSVETMINLHQHQFCRFGACVTQRLQRVGAMRPVVVSVWNKKTGAGNQN